ncbi:MAG: exodeoxyribonuclease V subunit gamma, partial [Planctomycetes bacterium]|nr:exodeoxyribonuclease V subunit gamma [Planctomycetota bacterium]
MIDVTTAQGLDALASALAARLRAEQADPFAVATVLVPRHATKAWLQLRLTRELGILANVRLGYLARVMQELLEPGQRLLGRDALQARALGVLFDEAWLARAECAPVRDYLRGAGSDVGAVERRAVQLADALATQLEDYLLHRPALLAAWEAGEQTLGDDAEQAGVEAWQGALWRELAVTGEGRAAGALDLRRLIAAVEAGAGEVPARLHVFGFTRLAPGYQALLVALARRGCAVQLYVQQACAPNAGGLLPQLWGRPGAEFLSGLGERCAQGAVELRVQAAPEQAGAGLLGRLQHRLARGGDEALELAPGERSLQVLAAPSLQREVEAVAGAIWERVEGAEPGLRFDEVGVAVVDPAWDVYRGRIDAVFGQASRLPTSLLERPPGEASRVVEAVELLLGLPLADFRRDDALRFLVHPNVQAGVEDADPQEWLSWCQELKVFHCADAADHAGTYLTRDLYSFDQAGQRLALGTFLAGGADGQGPPVVTLEGQSYLPAALAPGQQASAARFQLLLRSLIADVRFAQRARLTLGEWSRFFTALVRAYVVAAGADEQVYGRVLGKLARMAEWEQAEEAEPASAGAAGKGGRRQAPPLRGSGEQEAAGADAERGLPTQARRYGVQAAADLARAAIQGVEPGRGRSLTGGVIVGPLRSLAGLPFRVLFVLGLGERQFPAQPRRDLLDLRQAARQAGDVSPLERDRFAFLNALGGAQEALVLSYVQRDEQTGERLAPSSLLHQLRAGLGAVTPAQFAALEVEVPLRRFAAASFPPPLGR